MINPSLLFGALADSGRIKERKNGSYRMVLEDVAKIDWFKGLSGGVEGTWKPQKLLLQWDRYFTTSEHNSQATVEVGGQSELFTFVMSNPKIKSGKMIFNIKPLNYSGKDKITGLKNLEVRDIILLANDALEGSALPSCFPNCLDAQLSSIDLSEKNTFSSLNATDLSSASLTSIILAGSDLT